MEGMLAPEMKEEVLVLLKLERYSKFLKLDQLQVVWLWMVKFKKCKIKLFEGVVVHAGELIALKRFKDDVKSGQRL
jgi:translation initiation factor IF-2